MPKKMEKNIVQGRKKLQELQLQEIKLLPQIKKNLEKTKRTSKNDR